MALRAIDISITPSPAAGRIGLVGMPVWMWAQSPDDHTYGPITATASAGGITITAPATVQNVTWQMADGATEGGNLAGTPNQPKQGKRRCPDCGHVYETSSAGEPGGNRKS